VPGVPGTYDGWSHNASPVGAPVRRHETRHYLVGSCSFVTRSAGGQTTFHRPF
jgi:hypothetical protein